MSESIRPTWRGIGTAALASPLGAVAVLVLSGGVGLMRFHSRRVGAVVLLVVLVGLALASSLGWPPEVLPSFVFATVTVLLVWRLAPLKAVIPSSNTTCLERPNKVAAAADGATAGSRVIPRRLP